MSSAPPYIRATRRFAFLTIAGYSFVALASAIEALQAANKVFKHKAYEWVIASLDGKPVIAENGLSMASSVNIHDLERVDIVFVCGGDHIQELCSTEVIQAIRRSALMHGTVGGIHTGAHALAKAGLLHQHKAAIHWEYKSAVQALFTQVYFTDTFYVIDRNHPTCAGGTAAMHMTLKLIENEHGKKAAVMVSELLGIERMRDEQERQCIPMKSRVGACHANLIEVAELMEANIEEPLSLDHIAALVGISRRQLERLFKRYVGEIPSKYYMDIRLRHARNLIQQSDLSMLNIALACGFTNGAYFSRCYRDTYGVNPRAERISGVQPVPAFDAQAHLAQFASLRFNTNSQLNFCPPWKASFVQKSLR